MKVIVTSGGTREYVDEVRVVTNISSGKLGARISDVFAAAGDEVTYVAPIQAVQPERDVTTVRVSDTASVMAALEKLVPEADVVIHAMAVSDFTFDRDKPIKVASSDLAGFIDLMRQTIVSTPKVISNFTDWNPNAILVGFKFTVGETRESLLGIARKLMETNCLDLVVANDKVRMNELGYHEGLLVSPGEHEVLKGKGEIANGLFLAVTRLAREGGII